MKFSICTIAAFGSTIRKYATAFTRTGTLSLVMTSCGGMLSVIVRRSTFTIRSTIGIRRKRPGPFGSGSSRPRRNTIPRSYSRATLIADTRKSTTKKSRTAAMIRTATAPTLDGVDGEGETVDVVDAHALPRRERGLGARAPELAVDEDEPRVAHDPLHAHDLLRPDGHRPPAYLHRLRQRERPEPAQHRRHRHDERDRRLVGCGRLVEERAQADRQRDQPRDGERAVADDVRLEHEQPDPEQDEREARPREREHREAEEGRQQRHAAERA